MYERFGADEIGSPTFITVTTPIGYLDGWLFGDDYLELNHFEDYTAKQYYTRYNGCEVINSLAENDEFLKSDVAHMLFTDNYEAIDMRIREIIVNDSFKEIRDMWCDYRDGNN